MNRRSFFKSAFLWLMGFTVVPHLASEGLQIADDVVPLSQWREAMGISSGTWFMLDQYGIAWKSSTGEYWIDATKTTQRLDDWHSLAISKSINKPDKVYIDGELVN